MERLGDILRYKQVISLTGTSEERAVQCLRKAGWYPDRRALIWTAEGYYAMRNLPLGEGAKAFFRQYYGIAEMWFYGKPENRVEDFTFRLFPFQNDPECEILEYLEDWAADRERAEALAGDSLMLVGEIGHYYPATVWMGQGSTLYAAHDYEEEIRAFSDVTALIVHEFGKRLPEQLSVKQDSRRLRPTEREYYAYFT